jgi:hypothetical protein
VPLKQTVTLLLRFGKCCAGKVSAKQVPPNFGTDFREDTVPVVIGRLGSF